MKRGIVIALIAVTLAFAIEAGGFGGPMVVGMMPDFDDLNYQLSLYNTNTYGGSSGPEFSGPTFFLGGQGAAMVEGVSIGGWGGGFFKEAKGDSSKAILGYGMGYGEFGYRFNFFDILWVKPAMLIGGGGVGLSITKYRSSGGFGDPDGGESGDGFFPDFNEGYGLGKGFVNLGAVADLAVVFPMGAKSSAFSGINLKAGYLYAIYDSDWYDENFVVFEHPEFNFNGPFVSLGVVFGGRGETGDWFDDDGEDEDWEEW